MYKTAPGEKHTPTLPYAQTHTCTRQCTCVLRHTRACRVLLLRPDKSLSTDPCLCTSEGAEGENGSERKELVLLICFNFLRRNATKSSLNIPASLRPPQVRAVRLIRAYNFQLLAPLDCLSFSFSFPSHRLSPSPRTPPLFTRSPLAGIVLKGEISAFSAVPGTGTQSSPAVQLPLCYLGLYSQISKDYTHSCMRTHTNTQ